MRERRAGVFLETYYNRSLDSKLRGYVKFFRNREINEDFRKMFFKNISSKREKKEVRDKKLWDYFKTSNINNKNIKEWGKGTNSEDVMRVEVLGLVTNCAL